MHVAMGLAFSLILVAPFYGRWRANVWLRRHVHEEMHAGQVVEQV